MADPKIPPHRKAQPPARHVIETGAGAPGDAKPSSKAAGGSASAKTAAADKPAAKKKES